MIEKIFLDYSAEKLTQLSSRIQDCLKKLSNDQVWMRNSDNENAVGNLVLHLCGNVNQWIGSGVAGKADDRIRDREFTARGEVPPDDLAERLASAVNMAVSTIRGLSSARLEEKISVQKYDVTVLEAIYHVVEHFSQHTGQILFATKLLTGKDLGYYGHLAKSAHSETTP